MAEEAILKAKELVIKEVPSLLKNFASNADNHVFSSALRLAHDLISATKAKENDTEGRTRWEQHQRVTEKFADARESAEVAKKVFGFFEWGMGTEVSLFGNYPESVNNRFQTTPWLGDVGSLVIGYGPADLAVQVEVKRDSFDLNDYADFGWTDYEGAHTEFYNSNKRLYIRESMSGRTSYRLHIDEWGKVTPVPPSEWNDEDLGDDPQNTAENRSTL